MVDVQQKGIDEIFCSSCGAIIKKAAEICPKCGVRQKETSVGMNKQRIALAIASGFGMLATFLPWVTIQSKSFNGTKSGIDMDGMGWVSFVFFALPLIIAFLGNHTKPLAKIKYMVAAIGLTSVIFGSINIYDTINIPDELTRGQWGQWEFTKRTATVGLGLGLVIIAGIAVYFISIFAKWFGNNESVITKSGILISLSPLLLFILLTIYMYNYIYKDVTTDKSVEAEEVADMETEATADFKKTMKSRKKQGAPRPKKIEEMRGEERK